MQVTTCKLGTGCSQSGSYWVGWISAKFIQWPWHYNISNMDTMELGGFSYLQGCIYMWGSLEQPLPKFEKLPYSLVETKEFQCPRQNWICPPKVLTRYTTYPIHARVHICLEVLPSQVPIPLSTPASWFPNVLSGSIRKEEFLWVFVNISSCAHFKNLILASLYQKPHTN